MNVLTYIIIPLLAVIIIGFIMSRIFKDEEKKDTGFVLFYHQLSYRRRMFRSLWNIPLMVLLYLVIYWSGDLRTVENIVIAICFTLIVVVEFSYNYVKWNRLEKEV